MSERWLVFTVIAMSCLIVALMLVIHPTNVVEFVLIGLFSMAALVLAYIAGWAYGASKGRQDSHRMLDSILDSIRAAEHRGHLYSHTDGYEFGRMITLREVRSLINIARKKI